MWYNVKDKLPNPETPVLLTVISSHNDKPYQCIGMYYPEGYEVDYIPFDIDMVTREEIDAAYKHNEEEDTWTFLKGKWLELSYNATDALGWYIENDEVIAWRHLPEPYR